MTTVGRMIASVTDYTLEELEALERERPELGRVEVIDGALHATGESALGVWHQLIVARLYELMRPLCPPEHLVMLDTWWFGPRGKVRADLGIYDRSALPESGRVFRLPPRTTVEVLSDDAAHDLHLKDSVYAESGARRAYLEPYTRAPWWCRVDGVDIEGPTADWQLDGWPVIRLERAALLADVPPQP